MVYCSVVIWPTSSHRIGMLKVARCACLLSLTSISGGTSTGVSVLLRTQIGHAGLRAEGSGSASWDLYFFVGDKDSFFNFHSMVQRCATRGPRTKGEFSYKASR